MCLFMPALFHLVLHCHRDDGGYGVWWQSPLTLLAQREAERLKVFRAEVGVCAQRAFVPLSHRQPHPPSFSLLRKPAGQSFYFQTWNKSKVWQWSTTRFHLRSLFYFQYINFLWVLFPFIATQTIFSCTFHWNLVVNAAVSPSTNAAICTIINLLLYLPTIAINNCFLFVSVLRHVLSHVFYPCFQVYQDYEIFPVHWYISKTVCTDLKQFLFVKLSEKNQNASIILLNIDNDYTTQ